MKNSLILPTSLLEKYYNVSVPNIEKALNQIGIKPVSINYQIGPVLITYSIVLDENVDHIDTKTLAKLLNVENVRVSSHIFEIM